MANQQTFRYPEGVGTPPFDKWVRFDAMSRRHVFRAVPGTPEQNGKDDIISSVVLYLTESVLKSTLSVTWENTDLGVITGAILNAVGDGGTLQGLDISSMYSRAAAGADTLGRRALASIKDGTAVTGLIGAFMADLASSIPAGNPMQAVEAGLGAKINPRTEILFDTQQYRNYTMDFLLVPHNLAEAVAIDNIIEFFQFYMLPLYATADSMIGYPYEFNVGVFASTDTTRTKQLDSIAQIGRCVLRNVTVDHAAGSKVAFAQATGSNRLYPVATQLSLELQEVKLLDRSDAEIKRGHTLMDDPRNPAVPSLEPGARAWPLLPSRPIGE